MDAWVIYRVKRTSANKQSPGLFECSASEYDVDLFSLLNRRSRESPALILEDEVKISNVDLIRKIPDRSVYGDYVPPVIVIVGACAPYYSLS